MDVRHLFSRYSVPILVLTGLFAALIAFAAVSQQVAHDILLFTLIIGSIPLVVDVLSALRHRHFGVDLIAIVAMGTALVQGEYLAGSVIALMLSGGEALEEYALRRARRELTSLIESAPQTAHRLDAYHVLEDVPVDSVRPGDVLIVKPGEMIPVDGVVTEGKAMVDESAMTGESLPVQKSIHLPVMSGSVCKDAPLTIRAERPSSESKYAQIIRLIREAEDKKAPFVRLADRYSVWFTALTFLLALAAYLLSGESLRVLAVLVVATPCPLILATPIAFVAGISRSAKRGIIVRNGNAIERLGEARSFIFDKTGTLTLGVPTVTNVESFGMSEQEVHCIAASLDQLSAHVLARSLIRHAHEQGCQLKTVDRFAETFGEGVTGEIDGTSYIFGRLDFLRARGVQLSHDIERKHEETRAAGKIVVYLACGGELLGAVYFQDVIRPNVRMLFEHLRSLGIGHVRMLTGDKRETAKRIAADIGIQDSEIEAECLPDQKVDVVRRLQKESGPVVMVGDGINDAPALTAADVGIALGGHSFSAASESGDIVILVDDIGRVGEALWIGHAVLRIAKQSILAGIGLSTCLMVIAAFGYIPPVVGALLQEVIDVLVILNALRVLLIRSDLAS